MLDPKDGGPCTRASSRSKPLRSRRSIEHYLTTSEQIDSRLTLATDGERARGMLLQRMPSAGPDDDADLAASGLRRRRRRRPSCWARAAWKPCLPRDSERRHPRATAPPRALSLRLLERSRGKRLRMLGRSEIESILAEQGMIAVTCEFCNRSYSFVAADALALFTTG
jgi:molecular chaperone Hsp33